MKMPSKGSTVYLEDMGAPLFVKGPNMDSENPEVWVKYEGGELDKGYGRGIVSIPYEEFKEKRIYPEQQPDGEVLATKLKNPPDIETLRERNDMERVKDRNKE